jgi:hypothetical protein
LLSRGRRTSRTRSGRWLSGRARFGPDLKDLNGSGLQAFVERQVPVFVPRHFRRDREDGQVLVANRLADDKFAEPGLLGLCGTWFSRLLLWSRRIFGHRRLADNACQRAGR